MNPFVISKKQRMINMGVFSAALGAISVWRTMTPDPNNALEVYQVATYPISCAVGAALPAVLFFPFAYWLHGWFNAVFAKLWASRKRREALIGTERTPGTATSKAASPSETEAETETNLDDEQSWAAALKEYESGNRKEGLYAKLYVNFGGDESKIKVAYLKARVAELLKQTQIQGARAREAQGLEARASEARAFQKTAAARAAYRATYVGAIHSGGGTATGLDVARTDEARGFQKAAVARADYRSTYVGALHGGPPR